MTQPATRLINLIMLMQRRPNQKAADLADELGVSVRSLHRYMAGLDEMGIPVYSERGPYGGFSLVRGYKLPPLIFTAEESVVIALGAALVQEMWGKLYQQAASSALAKLDTLLPEAQRQEVAWARRSLLSLGMQRGNMEALAPLVETIRQAIHEHKQIEINYQGSNRPAGEQRRVDSYALAYRWGWWYLVGYCHTREAMRLFRVDRIKEYSLLDTAFMPRADFDGRAFVEQEIEGQGHLTVRLQFAPAMAQVARANPFNWQGMEEQPDGSIIAILRAPDLTWAASMALAYGPGVTVLEPEEVRQEVCTWARTIMEQYS